MPEQPCRWGILGTANIARKNWKAIRASGNAVLTAVAAREKSRAETFIAECSAHVPMTPAPTPCAGYEELLQRRDVDAVYIPLPTGIRKEWVIRAAQAGKHVLCEKPCGCNAADVRAMLDACKANRVQFMDGVMFMHGNRLALLRRTLDDETSIGTIARIASHFSFKGSEEFIKTNIRVSSTLEPLGCLGDLGWYNIRFSLWAMKEHLPERVSGRILRRHDSGDGKPAVPMEFSGELFFPGGASASFFCSFRAENQQWGVVSGTHGHLTVSDFVLPFYGSEAAFEVNAPVFRIIGCDFNMESRRRHLASHEYSNGAPDSQETNMIRKFSRIATSGKLEPHWGEQALATQTVLDACLRSAHEDGRCVSIDV